MDDKTLVLSKLHDIHLPQLVSWWPLAPGWYLLALIIGSTLIYVFYYLCRCWRYGKARRQALKILASYHRQYQENTDNALISMQISELLRRVALAYFPREQVASLYGQDWLDFLIKHANDTAVDGLGIYILELPYKPANQNDLEPFFVWVENWIKCRRKPCLL